MLSVNCLNGTDVVVAVNQRDMSELSDHKKLASPDTPAGGRQGPSSEI